MQCMSYMYCKSYLKYSHIMQINVRTQTLKFLSIVTQNILDNIFKYDRFVVEYCEKTTYLCYSVNGGSQSVQVDPAYIPAFRTIAEANDVAFTEMDLCK